MTTPQYQIITPKGNGGIATIVITGQDLEEKLLHLFLPFSQKSTETLPQKGIFKYGKFIDQNSEILDEVLLAKIKENHFEIHTHGGIFSLRKIIQELEVNNIQPIQKDAPNKTIESEYNNILSDTSTIREFQFLENQLHNYQNTFIPSADLSFDQKRTFLKEMIHHWRNETLQRRRVPICLAGLPNAGKSSLINFITGKDRALVSQQAKTTRDTITENFQTKGYRFQLIDTAGIHKPDNVLDQKSVELTYKNIQDSEIILWLHSTEHPFQCEEIDYLKKIKELISEKTRLCLALTKSDLNSAPISIEFDFDLTFQISCQSGQGVEELLSDIVNDSFDDLTNQKTPAALSSNMAKEIEQLILAVDLNESNHKMLDIYFEKLVRLTALMGKKESNCETR